MILRLLPDGRIIANRVMIAETFFQRLRGLLGKSALEDGEALYIRDCSMVHMLFMRFAIDVVFLSAEGTVVAMTEHLRPWRCSPWVPHAAAAVELADGTVLRHHIGVGDRLEVSPF